MFNSNIHCDRTTQPLRCVWVLDADRRFSCVWLPTGTQSVQPAPRLHSYTHLCSIGQCA